MVKKLLYCCAYSILVEDEVQPEGHGVSRKTLLPPASIVPSSPLVRKKKKKDLAEVMEEEAKKLLSYFNHRCVESLLRLTRSNLEMLRKRIEQPPVNHFSGALYNHVAVLLLWFDWITFWISRMVVIVLAVYKKKMFCLFCLNFLSLSRQNVFTLQHPITEPLFSPCSWQWCSWQAQRSTNNIQSECHPLHPSHSHSPSPRRCSARSKSCCGVYCQCQQRSCPVEQRQDL